MNRTRLVAMIVLAMLGASALVSVGAAAAGVLIYASRDSRERLTLAYLADSDDGATAIGAFRNSSSQDEEACAGRPDCIEGFIGEYVVSTRYSDRDAAAEAARNSRFETFQSDWILIEYTNPSLPDISRQDLEQTLDGMWQSED